MPIDDHEIAVMVIFLVCLILVLGPALPPARVKNEGESGLEMNAGVRGYGYKLQRRQDSPSVDHGAGPGLLGSFRSARLGAGHACRAVSRTSAASEAELA